MFVHTCPSSFHLAALLSLRICDENLREQMLSVSLNLDSFIRPDARVIA